MAQNKVGSPADNVVERLRAAGAALTKARRVHSPGHDGMFVECDAVLAFQDAVSAYIDRLAAQPTGDVVERVAIWSDEHRAYWRPDAAGYTIRLSSVGIYERAEAERLIAGIAEEKRLSLEPIPAMTAARKGGGKT